MMKLVLAIVIMCLAAISAGVEGQVAGGICAPTEPTCTVGCPPLGDEMGQANYQQASYCKGTRPPFPSPTPPCVSPASIAPGPIGPITIPPLPALPLQPTGSGPVIADATPAERQNIAVDEKYIYVLQSDEVVKLDKSDLHVVSRAKVR